MNREKQSGFSIIEMVIVCAIVGIIATLAIPFLQKAVRATENSNTFASMRTIHSSQMGFYQTNNRWGRLTEINNLMSSSLGTPSGNEVIHGKFVLSNRPDIPTDAQLRDRYTIRATRNVTGEGQVYVYELTEDGVITQILP
jgi:prepilin-type N-terminal cleavage/methylation domain-containing protein